MLSCLVAIDDGDDDDGSGNADADVGGDAGDACGGDDGGGGDDGDIEGASSINKANSSDLCFFWGQKHIQPKLCKNL